MENLFIQILQVFFAMFGVLAGVVALVRFYWLRAEHRRDELTERHETRKLAMEKFDRKIRPHLLKTAKTETAQIPKPRIEDVGIIAYISE